MLMPSEPDRQIGEGFVKVYWKDRGLVLLEYLRGDCQPGKRILGRVNPHLEGFRSNGRPAVLVVAAHPDDETIGVGCHMAAHKALGLDVAVVFGTNGRGNWKTRGRAANQVVQTRIGEATAALDILGIPQGQIAFLGYPDAGAYRYFSRIVADLHQCIVRNQPERIYVHAFEGGHADHDTMNLAVRCALSRIPSRPLVYEWAEYNARYPLGSSEMNFPDDKGCVIDGLGEQAFLQSKWAMLQIYGSQRVFPLCQHQPEVVRPLTVTTAGDLVSRFYGEVPFWTSRLQGIVQLCDEVTEVR